MHSICFIEEGAKSPRGTDAQDGPTRELQRQDRTPGLLLPCAVLAGPSLSSPHTCFWFDGQGGEER
jgi:hypothetical protein